MKFLRGILASWLVLGAVFSAGIGVRAAVAQDVQPPVAAGAALFASDCASCHRADGSGGMKFGSAVSADLRAPGLETTYRGSDKLILRAILYAKDQDGERLDHPMPAWKGRLSVAQAREIIAYLHTLHS
jgi:mono/diheme cytochrome c family protein